MGDKQSTRQVLVPLGTTGAVVLAGVLRQWFEDQHPNLPDGADPTHELVEWLTMHHFGLGRWHEVPEPR